ncbi:hypothetical protein YC2023_108493 [Brassica napus]
MWMTHVYQWAGGLLWLGHGRGQSVWALFGLFQEWFGSSRACDNCHRRKGAICTIDYINGQK